MLKRNIVWTILLFVSITTYGQNAVPVINFTVPDTICINNPLHITNTTTGATSFYWNFCVGNLNAAPVGDNLGNVDNRLSAPVFIDYVEVNGNFYGFLINHMPGGLVRLDFGNSLLNTPTATSLGNLGGVLPTGVGGEGIQVVFNEGRWYAIVVGFRQEQADKPVLARIDFGPNITNNSPAATDWGNIGGLSKPIDLHVFQENGNWFGFAINSGSSTITRFDFSTSFNNTPVGANLGNVGNLVMPTGIYAINENGQWSAFVTNAGDPNRVSSTFSSITRLDFGSSLLNTPTGVNLGNVGGHMHHPRDLTIIRSCGQTVGFVTNGLINSPSLVRLNFDNGLLATPTATNLGSIGNMSFPHSISRLFRVKDDVYAFITNVDNNTITRLRFAGCTNASLPSSAAQHPPDITYNAPGTYNINLTIDDGLPTQTAICKQVTVVLPPAQTPTRNVEVCGTQPTRLTAGTPNGTYVWNTGATTESIDVTVPGDYWVDIDRFGCVVRDSFVVTRSTADFSFIQQVCDPLRLELKDETLNSVNAAWDFGNGQTGAGATPQTSFPAYGDYQVMLTSQTASGCLLTATKRISVNLYIEDVISTMDTTVCANTNLQLDALPALEYCWSPAAGLSGTTIANPVAAVGETPLRYYLHSKVTGANLVVNGDFSQGNTGFSSSYDYTTFNNTEGQYTVAATPKNWNANYVECGDHTSGAGNMLIVNGSPQANLQAWSQNIAVTPNTNYAFSAWVQSVAFGNPAQLQWVINGKEMGGLISAELLTCRWTQFFFTWNSGNNTTANIYIINKNTQVAGNDYALDDISFAPVFVKRDSVNIIPEIAVVRTNNDITVCRDTQLQLNTTGTATYTWQPAASLSALNIANPVATVTANSRYIVTGTTARGCKANDTVQVNIFTKPAVTISNDTVVCPNTPVQLHIAGGASYIWSPAATLTNPQTGAPVASPLADTRYYVAIRDVNNCAFADSVDVYIHARPVFGATGGGDICQGESVTFNAYGGDTYEWLPGATLDNASSAKPVATPDMTTDYTVRILENTCNRDTTIHLMVQVNPVPQISVMKSNDIDCSIRTAQLTASGGLLYTWAPATGLTNPNIANPVAMLDTTTTFTVWGTSTNGCSSSAAVTVNVVAKGTAVFVMPNAFSPNGDGVNDCFGVRHWGAVRLESFSVYDRWGNLVFTSNDPNFCWNGTFNGKPLDAGTYVYFVKGSTFCGVVNRRGAITLIR